MYSGRGGNGFNILITTAVQGLNVYTIYHALSLKDYICFYVTYCNYPDLYCRIERYTCS